MPFTNVFTWCLSNILVALVTHIGIIYWHSFQSRNAPVGVDPKPRVFVCVFAIVYSSMHTRTTQCVCVCVFVPRHLDLHNAADDCIAYNTHDGGIAYTCGVAIVFILAMVARGGWKYFVFVG